MSTTPFIRETRYVVLKVTDAQAALTLTECNILNTLAAKVAAHRLQAGKTNLSGVFVEHDWPEYEPTWAAIEKRMKT